MSIVTGLTFGPKTTHRVLPLADVAYGPCADGTSFFCDGRGLETIDPMAMVDVSTAFTTTIICGPCRAASAAAALALETWGSEAA